MILTYNRPIIGELTSELAEIYNNLIRRGRLSCAEDGGRCNVVFNSGHAIKHVPLDDLEYPEIVDEKTKTLLKEYTFGNDLEGHITFPKVIGGSFFDVPFLVMQKFPNLTPFRLLNKTEQKDFQNQYNKQRAIVEKLGYIPGDLNLNTNCGLDKKSGRVLFYDFGDWEKN